MGGTVTEPSRSSLTPSWPPSGLKGWTSNPHKRGLCRNRRVQTACKFSREDEGSREVDGLRSAQALVSIGFGPATSAMGRSAFLVSVASSPSGRGQTLPLQEQTRASGMIYNCSIRSGEGIRESWRWGGWPRAYQESPYLGKPLISTRLLCRRSNGGSHDDAMRVGPVMTTSMPTAAHTISRKRRVAAPATSDTVWLATIAWTAGQASTPT